MCSSCRPAGKGPEVSLRYAEELCQASVKVLLGIEVIRQKAPKAAGLMPSSRQAES